MTSRINISFNQTAKNCLRDKDPFFLSRVSMNINSKFNKISDLSFGLSLAFSIQKSKEAIFTSLKKTDWVSHNVFEGPAHPGANPSVYQPKEVACV